MQPQSIKTAALLALAMAGTAQADFVVSEGWDLFFTVDDTEFLGVPFEGVPLELFDFGAPLGLKDVGNVDTIVRRLDDAWVDWPDDKMTTIDIELVALHLVSAWPFDPGTGLDFYFVTLDPDAPSLGEMDILFDDEFGGFFDSEFTVNFDLRKGSLDGPIVFSDSLVLESSGNQWGRLAAPGAVVIDGIDHLLKGDGTTDQDFWPGVPPGGGHASVIEHDASGAAKHLVIVPNPAALSLLALGVLTTTARRRDSATTD